VTAAVAEGVYGVQTPRLWLAPPRDDDSAGYAACRFYETMTGRMVLPWQELAVVEIMAERQRADGVWKWAASNACLIVARQNGKGDVLLIIELYHLFVLKARRIFHTAQLQRTATDAHQRMAQVIKNSPKLLAQVRNGERGIQYGKGAEQIVLADGRSILFFTRSDNAGRGLFGDLLICDEAYDLTEGEMAALRPLIKTSPAAQVIFTSTPVDGDSMPNGMVLAGVRKHAINGIERTLLLEWSVPARQRDEYGRNLNPTDERVYDVRCWAMANPSLNMRIAEGRVLLDPEVIEDDIVSLGTRKFLVEDLCAPDWWPDPDEEERDEIPFDAATFVSRGVSGQALLDPVALGIDRSPDGRTSLVAAGWHEDGTWGTETVAHRQGTEWVVPAINHLLATWDPVVLVLDAAGPAGSLVAKLHAAKLDPIVTGIAEMGRACQAMVDDFDEGRYVPSPLDSPLTAAVEIARWRDLGEARAFARKGFGDISPLVAAALAGYGLNLMVAFAKPSSPPPSPEALPSPTGGGPSWGAPAASSVATAGF
jgi:hypothetical protein